MLSIYLFYIISVYETEANRISCFPSPTPLSDGVEQNEREMKRVNCNQKLRMLSIAMKASVYLQLRNPRGLKL
jgi:hypothetical protein